MLKTLLNQCNLTLNLKAITPLLVKQGETEEAQKKRIEYEKRSKGEDGAIHMRFVRDARGDIYLPGSSLRGLSRSFAEKIIRTLSQDSGGFKCCDPFDDANSCSKRLEKQKIHKGPEAYQKSCPVCKLFGNTILGSRIMFTDAYPIPEGESEEQLKKRLAIDPICLKKELEERVRREEQLKKRLTRDHLPCRDSVPIDRFTGGAIAPFRYEYVIDLTFQTKIIIRNFELWQLGLLVYLFRDLREELLHLGFGKSRAGFGKIKGTLARVEFIYLGRGLEGLNTLSGLGALYADDKELKYGLVEKDKYIIEQGVEFLTEEIKEGEDTSMKYRYAYTVKDEYYSRYAKDEDKYKHEEIWKWLAPKWNDYLKDKCPPIR